MKKITLHSFRYTLFTFLIVFSFSCSEKEVVKNETSTQTVIENVGSKIEELSKNQILVCAHRAYHKLVPENSLASIQQAIDAKIDIVEIDVATTKDGVLVLMHDKSIDRTTNGKGWVSTLNFSELKPLFLKIKDSVTAHKIPTLNEALKLAKDKVILNLDIKGVDMPNFYQQLKVNKMEDDVFSFIWDKAKINEILEIDSTYAVLPLVSKKSEIEYYLNNVNSKLQHFDDASFTSENVLFAKNNGIYIFMNSLWKVDEDFIKNNTSSMDIIIDFKPAIIQTDHPKLLVEYLRTKKLHD